MAQAKQGFWFWHTLQQEALISESNILSSFSWHLPAICCTPPFPRVRDAAHWGHWEPSSDKPWPDESAAAVSSLRASAAHTPWCRGCSAPHSPCPCPCLQPQGRAGWVLHSCTSLVVSFLPFSSHKAASSFPCYKAVPVSAGGVGTRLRETLGAPAVA